VDTVEHQVRYGRLPYGDYRFRIAASHTDGVWHEASAPFAFQVPTPLWRTPGAMGLYVLTVVGVVAGIVRLVSHRRLRRHLARLEQQQALERERVRIAQDMHDDIGSKLTKISFLSERAKVELSDNAKAAGQIESIASTSRELLQTLDEIVWAVNPHNDTLEHLAAYLAQYAADYFTNTTMECDLRLPRQLPDHDVSAEARHNLFLAFEEALNNVLKHSGASKVRVEMKLNPVSPSPPFRPPPSPILRLGRGGWRGEELEINVTDNGCGFESMGTAEPPPGGQRGGNGLINMRQRMADVKGLCEIRSEPGCGTTVSLRIPLDRTTPTER
jgi:signal transduction histidine kinase